MRDPLAVPASPLSRLSVPARGRSVRAAVEIYAPAIRRAARELESALEDATGRAEVERAFPAAGDARGVGAFGISPARRAGWALTAATVVRQLVVGPGPAPDLGDAARWFGGDATAALAERIPRRVRARACDGLGQVTYDEALRDLLPHVLDPHDPGTRLSVRRHPNESGARRRRKAAGVFYTPSDVADHIAEAALDAVAVDASAATVLDPACGSGVFLRSALQAIRRRRRVAPRDTFALAATHLFGIDIDPLAVDVAAFVLLLETEAGWRGRRTPQHAWAALRRNLAASNALLTAPVRHGGSAASGITAPWVRLGELLPTLAEGASILMGNPPYAPLGRETDHAEELARSYASLTPGAVSGAEDTSYLFLEMTWRLLKRHGAAALVLPLGIACGQGRVARRCRRAMQAAGGGWDVAFFDREPHALFGEDVKTRNVIAVRKPAENGSAARLAVTPLLKWRSGDRSRLFGRTSFTPVACPDFGEGLPKLGSRAEAAAYDRLARARPALNSPLYDRIGSADPSEAFSRSRVRVYVASTAYNFLSVFRWHEPGLRDGPPLTTNRIHALEYPDVSQAWAGYAVLNSRLVYWLWRVEADGFHVTRRFLKGIPIDRTRLPLRARTHLERLGRSLWKRARIRPSISLNKGRKTVAYDASRAPAEQDAIDVQLADVLGLDRGFPAVLRDHDLRVSSASGMTARETAPVDE